MDDKKGVVTIGLSCLSAVLVIVVICENHFSGSKVLSLEAGQREERARAVRVGVGRYFVTLDSENRPVVNWSFKSRQQVYDEMRVEKIGATIWSGGGGGVFNATGGTHTTDSVLDPAPRVGIPVPNDPELKPKTEAKGIILPE